MHEYAYMYACVYACVYACGCVYKIAPIGICFVEPGSSVTAVPGRTKVALCNESYSATGRETKWLTAASKEISRMRDSTLGLLDTHAIHSRRLSLPRGLFAKLLLVAAQCADPPENAPPPAQAFGVNQMCLRYTLSRCSRPMHIPMARLTAARESV